MMIRAFLILSALVVASPAKAEKCTYAFKDFGHYQMVISVVDAESKYREVNCSYKDKEDVTIDNIRDRWNHYVCEDGHNVHTHWLSRVVRYDGLEGRAALCTK